MILRGRVYEIRNHRDISKLLIRCGFGSKVRKKNSRQGGCGLLNRHTGLLSRFCRFAPILKLDLRGIILYKRGLIGILSLRLRRFSRPSFRDNAAGQYP